MIIDWNDGSQAYIELSISFNWHGGYVPPIIVAGVRYIFIMDTKCRLLSCDTQRREFEIGTGRRLFHKDTKRRIFEKDTATRIFMP